MSASEAPGGSLPAATVQAQAPDLGLPEEACLFTGPLDPCTLVIFGASGDLAGRKLLPALLSLFRQGALPTPFLVVGCARSEFTSDSFRAAMWEKLQAAGGADRAVWEDFAPRLHYLGFDYSSLASYVLLNNFLQELEREHPTQGNRIFYLAVPPSLYQEVALLLHQAGMAEQGVRGQGWARIVVEKPFGRDLASALELNRTLRQGFREEQIFRIDHYMAKETVQNVLIFRFANTIFEPLWHRHYIEQVGIIAAETLGVEQRASFYEETGVLRDMFQNHMLQLLALIAMEPPSLFESQRVRDEKAKVFRSLKPLEMPLPPGTVILGQYTAGEINGRRVPGYREEPGVSPDSLTPTFALLTAHLDNWRWQGVPFHLLSGKRLAQKLTRIVIQFREVPHSLFRNVHLGPIQPNRLVIGIHPEEAITLTFETKNPGALVCLRRVTMEFPYYQNYRGPILEAYEKSLLDVIQGDQMLFWRQDAVELAWQYLDPLIRACETCPDPARLLKFYPAGSWGPPEAAEVTGPWRG
ncbi:MAG: glucose-6-phosphate dehydrogenase [Syntrophobacterales bacterium]|nr:glucose-6-phosphate dehydrogenase [Syntrophobacterales bacterium]